MADFCLIHPKSQKREKKPGGLAPGGDLGAGCVAPPLISLTPNSCSASPGAGGETEAGRAAPPPSCCPQTPGTPMHGTITRRCPRANHGRPKFVTTWIWGDRGGSAQSPGSLWDHPQPPQPSQPQLPLGNPDNWWWPRCHPARSGVTEGHHQGAEMKGAAGAHGVITAVTQGWGMAPGTSPGHSGGHGPWVSLERCREQPPSPIPAA